MTLKPSVVFVTMPVTFVFDGEIFESGYSTLKISASIIPVLEHQSVNPVRGSE